MEDNGTATTDGAAGRGETSGFPGEAGLLERAGGDGAATPRGDYDTAFPDPDGEGGPSWISGGASDLAQAPGGESDLPRAQEGEGGAHQADDAEALPRIPYGEWPSPIAATQVAGSRLRVAFPTVIGETTWWQEDRPEEGGRTTIMRCGPDGVPVVALAAPWAAQSRVHEYGGLAYLPVPSEVAAAALAAAGQDSGGAGLPIVFANLSDQRLYLVAADGSGQPIPLTPDPTTPGSAAEPRSANRTGANGTGTGGTGTGGIGTSVTGASVTGTAGTGTGVTGANGTGTAETGTSVTGTAGTGTSVTGANGTGTSVTGTAGALEPRALRYADFVLSPDGREVWCVRERHQRGKVTRAIVAVPLDGSAGTDAMAVRVLVSGFDFFAFPTVSPDGNWLAWICWNHPHMPWDGTELRVAPLEDGVPAKSRLIKGSNRESVLAPVWRDNASLYVATDWTGWWNIYQIGLHGEPPQALFPADEEFADALWQLGGRPFAKLADGRLVVRHGRGSARLGILDPETSDLVDLTVPFTEFLDAISVSQNTIACIAGAARDSNSVVRIDAVSGHCTVLRTEISDLPDRRFLPIPRPIELEGPYGRVVHAILYPPTNPEVSAPEEELPPYIVWVHGGPTSHSTARLSLEKAYFTSRGIGIIDVNYGGSTGYGRLYRNRLNREWGVVDVADAKEAARSLARAGEADEARLGIRGGSAGGWTALGAVTTGAAHDPVFSAAVSYYGVCDLRGIAGATHDFESRYLDWLIGPLPGFDTVYAERAPVGHVNPNTCPVLLLQGLDDPVVPPQQSESIAADLAAQGISHAYLTFEGESHGFRRADSMVTSLEAELSFYGQVLGFTPRNVPEIKLTDGEPG